jgi:hypothetical protein
MTKFVVAVIVTAFVESLLKVPPARAQNLEATKPGVMCASESALAKLTRPDGSSLSAGTDARPEDRQVAAAGNCIPIRIGAVVIAVQVRRNTAIVNYDDGRGYGTYYVPNVDFRRTSRRPTEYPSRPALQCSSDRPLFNTTGVLQKFGDGNYAVMTDRPYCVESDESGTTQASRDLPILTVDDNTEKKRLDVLVGGHVRVTGDISVSAPIHDGPGVPLFTLRDFQAY